MMNMPDVEKLELINEELIIISSVHSVLRDSMLYREFNDRKNLIGDYNIVMDIIESHIKNILRLF